MVRGRIKDRIVALIVVFIAGCVLTGFFAPISHPSLHRRAETLIRKKTGLDSCHAGKVTIVPFRGITVTELVCCKRLNARENLTVFISSLKIPYRFFSIVSRWKKVKHSLNPAAGGKRKNRIQWHTRSLFSALYSRVISTDTLLLACVKSITGKNIRVTVDSINVTTAFVEKGYGAVSILESSPPQMKVKFKAKSIQSKTVQIEQPVVRVLVNGPHCTVEKATGSIYDGKCKASCDILCMQDKITNGEFTLSDFDLAQWYPILGDTIGSLAGTGMFSITFDTTDLSFSGFKGKGRFTMTDVTADSLPLVTVIAMLTGLEALSHLTFKELSGDFLIKEGKIYSDNINGTGDPLTVDIAGWLRPADVYFDFEMKGLFEAYYEDSISAVAWNAMLPEKDGRRLFKCSIYGTPERPGVSLDRRIAKRAVRSVFKSLGQEIKGMFKKRKQE